MFAWVCLMCFLVYLVDYSFYLFIYTYYLNVMFLHLTRTALNFVLLVTMTIKIFYSM